MRIGLRWRSWQILWLGRAISDDARSVSFRDSERKQLGINTPDRDSWQADVVLYPGIFKYCLVLWCGVRKL